MRLRCACGARFNVDDSYVGQQVICLKCGRALTAAPADDDPGPSAKRPLWLTLGLVGGLNMLLLVVLALWFSSKHGGTPGKVEARLPDAPASQPRSQPAAAGQPARKGPTKLVIDWPPAERRNASLTVDGRPIPLPASGPVECEVRPGVRQVVITRPGYQGLNCTNDFEEGETFRFRPSWLPLPSTAGTTASGGRTPHRGPSGADIGQRLPSGPPPSRPKGIAGFDDWVQDFEAAKHRAAAEEKDILLAFDGSDWCGWSVRLAAEVFFQEEFRNRADPSYVLVFVDFPRTPAGRRKVQDPRRNEQLARQFQIDSYPTIIVTDAAGLPYGRLGYGEGGVAAFLERLDSLRTVRKDRDDLLASIDSAAEEGKVAAIAKTVRFLGERQLSPYYTVKLDEWLALVAKLDPGNAKGQQEVLFEAVWMARLWQIEEPDRARVVALADEFDQWRGKHKFQDPDRAVSLHLIAATCLAGVEEVARATKVIDNAMAYKPKDLKLAARLKVVRSQIYHIASGTGFVVGAEGHILTNHHVVDGPGKLQVLLPGREDPVSATVVAKDAGQDIALIKIEAPLGVSLRPLAISSGQPLSRGAQVGVFGYPLGDAVGSGLKLTTGVVSAMPEKGSSDMLLLDCRVNPGNSGGPLCDLHGAVVGMVTAKSQSGFGVESYGMAIPAEALRTFLDGNLPDGHKRPPTRSMARRLEWQAIDQMISPSVLMVVRSR